jgi:sugar lactone lactonase YvrE
MLARPARGYRRRGAAPVKRAWLAGATVTIVLAGCGLNAHRAATGADRATSARACPGAAFCPYEGVTVIGRRAEGVFRFPEAIALGPGGDVYVADQFSHVVQKFSPGGAFETEWGSYGGGAGQFGAIDGLATDSSGDVYVVDAPTTACRRSPPTAAS